MTPILHRRWTKRYDCPSSWLFPRLQLFITWCNRSTGKGSGITHWKDTYRHLELRRGTGSCHSNALKCACNVTGVSIFKFLHCTTVTHFISVRRCSNLLVRAQRLCFSDPCCHCGKKKWFVCFVTKDDNKNKQIGRRSFYHLNKETTVTQKNKLWLFTILSWKWPTMDHTSRDGSLNTSSLSISGGTKQGW